MVRCLARDAACLERRFPGVTLIEGDLLDEASLREARAGIDVAYCLVHSLSGSRDFADVDRETAARFAKAARAAGVKRIIYLGGLGADESALSNHLRSAAKSARCCAKAAFP
jgi:uncharacterized protein YbjT (DUF2867 family)